MRYSRKLDDRKDTSHRKFSLQVKLTFNSVSGECSALASVISISILCLHKSIEYP